MKHKLKPLKEIDEKVCSTTRICVVDGRKFLDTMRHEHMCFPKILQDGKEEVDEVPTEVADLLEEFLDIVSDNIPDGFSLVQKISHQMDLIPEPIFQTRLCTE